MTHKTTTLFTAAVLIAACLSMPPAGAADISFGSQGLNHAVRQGKHLFTTEHFGGKGRTCDSCHRNGGVGPGKTPDGKKIPSLTNAAAIFPVYKPKFHGIVTLEDQIRHCIANALQGNPPPYDSPEIRALTTYVTSLAEGKSIHLGGKPR